MKPIYINMPVGEFYGWAICGKNLVRELHKLTDIKYIPDEQYINVQRDYPTNELIKSITEMPNGNNFNTLQTIDNVTPMKYKGEKNVGYMFWEQETIPDYLIEQLKAYDVIATGSTWNTNVVKNHGFDNVATIHQGVDCERFKPMDKMYFKDKFVIFSGGKLEHRKAQDIVAYVVGKMQKKYKDVYLIANWTNIFAKENEFKNQIDVIKKYLLPNQTVFAPLSGQHEIIKFIAETDIGLFPNRSEGGTNLVMMEYMACGKPVVANYVTGQKDVLDKDYAFLVEGRIDYGRTIDDKKSIEECANALENAYFHKEQLKNMGNKAREVMQTFTWEKTAKEFLKLYE